MGAFFTNCQVRRTSPSAVANALAKLIRSRAYISPEKNGWVTVYAEATEEQDQAVLCRIAAGLSKVLKTDVFGFLVHDSDIAAYWLYRCGALADEFNSAPDYFGETVDDATRARVRGSPDALLPLCVAGTTRAQIEAVIHPSDGFQLMAEQILADLAELLGIDESRIALGFNYFAEEGEEMLPDADQFEPVGRGAERKESVSPDADDPSEESAVEIFPMAVSMLAQCWSRQNRKQMQVSMGFSGAQVEDMLKQLAARFDHSARDMLKHSRLPDRPTFEELKAARDRGPDALAELIAKRTPAMLTDIGVGAAVAEAPEFLAALLNRGLDPSATGCHGMTTLAAASKHGQTSAVYQLAKSAADKQK
jgi:hypothetical protein